MKLIVYLHSVESFVNINADQIEKDESFIMAYNNGKLVGMFDIGTIMAMYLSEKKGTE